MIDLILYFLNKKPKFVYCAGSKKFTKNTKYKNHNNLVIILEFVDETIVKINANALSNYPHFHELKIFQKNKTIIHSLKNTFEYKKSSYFQLKGKYPDKKNNKILIQDFLKSLINNKNNNQRFYPNFNEQLDLMSICFAAEKSLLSSRREKIIYV